MKGVILAAPASGSGKTLLTLGLLRAYRQRGVDVAGAKTGPDYIDPGFHAAATGRVAVNLDPWAMRPGRLGALAAGIAADLVLCEGVMGLFDGAGLGDRGGSTADLAALTGWPVVLIVDARGQAGSVAALLQGFAGFRRDISLAGLIFNRVASPRHQLVLERATRAALPELTILGALPQDRELRLPERHLGLVLAQEHAGLDAFLDHAGALVAGCIDLPTLQGLARPLARRGLPDSHALPPLGQRIAVARDAAFAFAYPHLLAGWRAAGAEILPFSPLADEAPDHSADAVFLPGGYPELYAGVLADARGCWDGLAEAAARGAFIYGECGGYMALGRGLIDRGGICFAMAGLLPLVTSFADPRRHLGYRQALALAGPWQGQLMRGHEFHYASEQADGQPCLRLWQLSDAEGGLIGEAGQVQGRVMGSFFHIIDPMADSATG